MTANQLRQKYLDFFKSKDHVIVPSAPLVPENDPTTLFTGSGMQPMINYFLGEKHPLGNRITDSQKCFRAEDIDEVGDNRHTTFFEMLGNWSFGDYWKAEQLHWVFEFFTREIGLDPNKLYVSVFKGNQYAPKDEEAIKLWQEIFNTKEPSKLGESGFDPKIKIYEYDETKNWWSRSGTPQEMPTGEPGGTTSEVFYLFDDIEHDPAFGKHCHPNCDCGRFLEIGNSVFMEYKKEEDGSFSPLPQKNIDFGGGFERIAAASNNNPDIFTTEIFAPLIKLIETQSGQSYPDHKFSMRVIADHIRGAVHMVSDGIVPSNKMQGYMLRRLLRKSIVELDKLSLDSSIIDQLTNTIINTYQEPYPQLIDQQRKITTIIETEVNKFRRTVKKGLKEFSRLTQSKSTLTGDLAFKLYETYGFPLELSMQEAKARNIEVSANIKGEFSNKKTSHSQKSRTASKGMFKGGLADNSETTTKYHTTTHLLHQALRDVLGNHVQQMGSNITKQRLRFDFKHSQKLTQEQKQQIENIINQKIKEDLPVHKTIEPKEAALESGALAFFRETYPNKVSVYTIGKNPKLDWYSKELCGGPHVSSTGEIGAVTIKKEESVGAGARRIYMVLKSAD